MTNLDRLDAAFIVTAFLFQLILIVHFTLRKWRFAAAMRFGPLVYALGAPAAVLSLVLLLGGKDWSLWLGGFLYLAWGLFGYTVEYLRKVQWRNPIRWSVFVPYLLLYLGTSMFYWFPLALVWKPLWFVQAVLFAASLWLNVSSHAAPPEATHPAA